MAAIPARKGLAGRRNGGTRQGRRPPCRFGGRSSAGRGWRRSGGVVVGDRTGRQGQRDAEIGAAVRGGGEARWRWVSGDR